MNRRFLTLCAVGLLVVLSGCLGGTSEIPEEELAQDAEYEWDADATVHFNLTESRAYTAVIDVENRSELRIHRETVYQGDQPIDLRALQFRFENGTVVNGTHEGLNATRTSDETVLSFPASNGTVAYTAPRAGKSFASPVFIEGSYSLDLPEGTRVGIPLLSQTRPGGYESVVEDNRMSLVWEELSSGSIRVQYYLVRDLYLFGGLFLLASFVGVAGVTYYLREIRQAKAKREEVGLDVEVPEDDSDGPPPGMR